MFCKHGPENKGYGFSKNCFCCPDNSCYVIYQTPLQALDFTSKLAAFCPFLWKTLNPAGGQIDFRRLSLSLWKTRSILMVLFFQCHSLSWKCTHEQHFAIFLIVFLLHPTKWDSCCNLQVLLPFAVNQNKSLWSKKEETDFRDAALPCMDCSEKIGNRTSKMSYH